jgi:hypothetical protein
VFKWLSRSARNERSEASVPRDPVADAIVSVDTLGRLSGDLVEGAAPPSEPGSEYIEKAADPTAEAWEHEREARAAQEEAES